MRRDLGHAWGTLQYHLARLKEAGILRDIEIWSEHRYFGRNLNPGLANAVAVLRHAKVERLARAIVASPGAHQRALLAEAGLTRKVLRGYVGRLVESGLILERRASIFRRYFPTPLLFGAIAALEPPKRPDP